MTELTLDIHEQILIRLEVNDLIRFKSVCKSWHSLISDHRFIKSHLKHTYKKDFKCNEIGYKRINMICSRFSPQYVPAFKCDLVGSSNGLVCISCFDSEILVANPSTREVKKLKNPQIHEPTALCFGFGYDSLIDDYKVVLGLRTKGAHNTRFLTLKLKTNVWEFIGELKYTYVINTVGTLCNGTLHWLILDRNDTTKSNNSYKKVILAFELSENKFKEIPQPEDARYERFGYTRLGIINDCLCIFDCNGWVMKNYNVKSSWEPLRYNFKTGDGIADYMQTLKSYVPPKSFFGHAHIWVLSTLEDSVCPVFVQSLVSSHGDFHLWLFTNLEYVGYPVYVQSLVSPHGNGRLKRNSREVTDNNGSGKLIKGDPSVAGSSAKV